MSIVSLLTEEGIVPRERSLVKLAEAVRLGLLTGMDIKIAPDIVMDPQLFLQTFMRGYHIERDHALKIRCGSCKPWYIRVLSGHLKRKSFEEDCRGEIVRLSVPGAQCYEYSFFPELEDWSSDGATFYMGAFEVSSRLVKLKRLGVIGQFDEEWEFTFTMKGLPKGDTIHEFLQAISDSRCYLFVQLIAPDGETAVANVCVPKDWEDPFCQRSRDPQHSDAFVAAWSSNGDYEEWYKYHKEEVHWAEGWSAERFIAEVRTI